MTADVTVSVPVLEYGWSATLADGEKIEVPGFPLEIEGFATGELDVDLQCSLKNENGTINFKVSDPFFYQEVSAKIFPLFRALASSTPTSNSPLLLFKFWNFHVAGNILP